MNSSLLTPPHLLAQLVRQGINGNRFTHVLVAEKAFDQQSCLELSTAAKLGKHRLVGGSDLLGFLRTSQPHRFVHRAIGYHYAMSCHIRAMTKEG